MTVRLASRTIYSGTLTPLALNTETNVVNIPSQTEFYMIEGYIDLSPLASGDTLKVREYLAVDGSNLRKFCQTTYSGALEEPVIRFHTKTFRSAYRVTIEQTTGTLRNIPYWFILELAEVT